MLKVMNRRGFGSLVITLIIFLAIVVIGGVWYYEAHPFQPSNLSGSGSVNASSDAATPTTGNIGRDTQTTTIVADSISSGYITIRQASTTNMMMYDATPEGFQFQFPSYLSENGNNEVRDQQNNFSILIDVFFSPAKPDIPSLGLIASTSTVIVNGLPWTKFAERNTYKGTGWFEGSGYFVSQGGVTIELSEEVGSYIPTSAPPVLADRDAQAVNDILSTFAFTNPSLRLDHEIGAVKVGDKYGSLTVSRVITGKAGEIDFTGQLTLIGTFDAEVQPTGDGMGQGQVYYFGNLDLASVSRLPQIGQPVAYNEYSPLLIYLDNQDLASQFGSQVSYPLANDQDLHFFSNETSTIVIDGLQEVYYSEGQGA